MRHYTKIFRWENQRRIEKLLEFRSLVFTYFENSRYDPFDDLRVEQSKALEVRDRINLCLSEIHAIILSADVVPVIIYRAPPLIGGYQSTIDLFENIFNLDRYQIGPNVVIDYVDRTIGKYRSDQTKAIFRMFNPFFYLGLLLAPISDLLFEGIGKLGFNRQKLESSIFGNVVKGLPYLLTILAALLTILHYLDLLDPIKATMQSLMGSKTR